VPRARLRAGELIAAAGGALLVVSMLLPWYARDTEVAGVLFSESWNAWQSVPAMAIPLFVVATAAIGLPGARALGASLGGLRVDRALVALGLLAVAIVAFRLIDIPIAAAETEPGDRADTSRGIGLLLALLGAAAIACGGRVRSSWPR
jgi:hypothetical protein